MTVEREELESLLKIRKRLEKRIARLKAELESLTHLLRLLDRQIGELSFKPAATLKPETAEALKPPEAAVKPPTPPGQTIPLKASDGKLLATMYVARDEIRVIPAENVSFNVKTPPFQQFLVSKVLNGMEAKDREAAASGQIPPDQILTYKVIQENGEIREIVVRNYREERRAASLKNAFRWTLEKMYEKTKL
ncbi:MAG: hypothetical protein DRO46_00295 [Candidatus Hecatellales archaeon]|nr:MAG: hypothetical protein DRO46_00295 [Candidatus Hecatellales archaeon]